MSKVLVETAQAFIYEDGTYVYKEWDEQFAFWKIEEDGELMFRHSKEDDQWYRILDFPHDTGNKERWRELIMSAIIEREIFGD